MRRSLIVAVAVLAVACAKTNDQAGNAVDTAQAAPAAPAGITLADVKGAWHMNAMPLDKDTVLTSLVMWASEDTAAWKTKFDNRADTIKVRVLGVAGDSIMTEFGPYSSALRKNVKVVTDATYRLQGDKLIGHVTAHYSVPTADSLVHLRTEGTRVQ